MIILSSLRFQLDLLLNMCLAVLFIFFYVYLLHVYFVYLCSFIFLVRYDCYCFHLNVVSVTSSVKFNVQYYTVKLTRIQSCPI